MKKFAGIVGLLGLAGSGKDTVADLLVQEHGFAKLAFADPLKRICREVFDFSDEQLWGPSEKRNAPDPRYPRKVYGSDKVVENLTPRYALQTLGTEWGRDCYAPIWMELGLRTAKRILEHGEARYSARKGLYYVEGRLYPADQADEPMGVAISDVRFRNEVDGVRAAGGKVIKIVRPGAGLGGGAGLHPSEVEQASIPDDAFDAILHNDGTLEDLATKVGQLLTDLAR